SSALGYFDAASGVGQRCSIKCPCISGNERIKILRSDRKGRWLGCADSQSVRKIKQLSKIFDNQIKRTKSDTSAKIIFNSHINRLRIGNVHISRRIHDWVLISFGIGLSQEISQ